MESVSLPTLRRLPKYLMLLQSLEQQRVIYVSTTLIAHELGIEAIQVRKDLEVTGVVGKPKVGFVVSDLIQGIIRFLNWDNRREAFLIGVGALGSAILGYQGFREFGLDIIAGFDNDPRKIGKTIHGIEILDIVKLGNLIERMKVRLAVLTVPAAFAPEIAGIMIFSGIKAIWNFAPCHIKAREGVVIENVSLSQSLGVLTHRLSKMEQNYSEVI